MRPIDVDAMIARLKAWDTKDKTDKALYNFTLNRINEQPTVDVQSGRKLGKWIKEKCRGQAYKCSVCGNYLDFRCVNAGRGNANYCPNCGARMEMDGEQNDIR